MRYREQKRGQVELNVVMIKAIEGQRLIIKRIQGRQVKENATKETTGVSKNFQSIVYDSMLIAWGIGTIVFV
jgi:hypothetical protein